MQLAFSVFLLLDFIVEHSESLQEELCTCGFLQKYILLCSHLLSRLPLSILSSSAPSKQTDNNSTLQTQDSLDSFIMKLFSAESQSESVTNLYSRYLSSSFCDPTSKQDVSPEEQLRQLSHFILEALALMIQQSQSRSFPVIVDVIKAASQFPHISSYALRIVLSYILAYLAQNPDKIEAFGRSGAILVIIPAISAAISSPLSYRPTVTHLDFQQNETNTNNSPLDIISLVQLTQLCAIFTATSNNLWTTEIVAAHGVDILSHVAAAMLAIAQGSPHLTFSLLHNKLHEPSTHMSGIHTEADTEHNPPLVIQSQGSEFYSNASDWIPTQSEKTLAEDCVVRCLSTLVSLDEQATSTLLLYSQTLLTRVSTYLQKFNSNIQPPEDSLTFLHYQLIISSFILTERINIATNSNINLDFTNYPADSLNNTRSSHSSKALQFALQHSRSRSLSIPSNSVRASRERLPQQESPLHKVSASKTSLVSMVSNVSSVATSNYSETNGFSNAQLRNSLILGMVDLLLKLLQHILSVISISRDNSAMSIPTSANETIILLESLLQPASSPSTVTNYSALNLLIQLRSDLEPHLQFSPSRMFIASSDIPTTEDANKSRITLQLPDVMPIRASLRWTIDSMISLLQTSTACILTPTTTQTPSPNLVESVINSNESFAKSRQQRAELIKSGALSAIGCSTGISPEDALSTIVSLRDKPPTGIILFLQGVGPLFDRPGRSKYSSQQTSPLSALSSRNSSPLSEKKESKQSVSWMQLRLDDNTRFAAAAQCLSVDGSYILTAVITQPDHKLWLIGTPIVKSEISEEPEQELEPVIVDELGPDVTFSDVKAGHRFFIAKTTDGVLVSFGQNEHGECGRGVTVEDELESRNSFIKYQQELEAERTQPPMPLLGTIEETFKPIDENTPEDAAFLEHLGGTLHPLNEQASFASSVSHVRSQASSTLVSPHSRFLPPLPQSGRMRYMDWGVIPGLEREMIKKSRSSSSSSKRSSTSSKFSSQKPKVSGKVLSFSCGSNHVECTTEAGRVFVWGMNESGQLGNNNKLDQFKPIELTDKSFADVATQESHRSLQRKIELTAK